MLLLTNSPNPVSDLVMKSSLSGFLREFRPQTSQPRGIAGHWNQVHRMLHERAWLDKYLKRAPGK